MRPHPKPTRKHSADVATSDALAIEALTFLAADAERLTRFFDTVGLDPDALRAAASPVFLDGVLDYLCSDEPLLIAFAEETKRNPAAVEAARQNRAGPPWPG